MASDILKMTDSRTIASAIIDALARSQLACATALLDTRTWTTPEVRTMLADAIERCAQIADQYNETIDGAVIAARIRKQK